MCVTICERFRSDEGAVAGYGNRIRVKYPAKWGVQIAGMIFQTRSTPDQSLLLPWTFKIIETSRRYLDPNYRSHTAYRTSWKSGGTQYFTTYAQ